MVYKKENEKFDTWIDASDWRFSASIVGLYKFFDYYRNELEFEYDDEYFKFHSEDITKELYLKFVEHYYNFKLPYYELEQMLRKNINSEEDVKNINKLLKANAIMKDVFKEVEFSQTNGDFILELIDRERLNLIQGTFLNKKNMYTAFANTKLFFSEILKEKPCCRLNGYYVDYGRKSKSIAFLFDKNRNVMTDFIYFDFIPFAFVGDMEWYFINNNITISDLIRTNENFFSFLQESKDGKKSGKALFELIQISADFINYDVEVIKINSAKEYYETLFIRKKAVDVIKGLRNNKILPFKEVDYKSFCRFVPLKKNPKDIDDYLNIESVVVNHILNNIYMDDLIEFLLKTGIKDNNYRFLIRDLISLNYLMKGEKIMVKKSLNTAYACAKEVSGKIPENKINSYRAKLISSLIARDNDKYCQTLLQLSNYSNVSFGFAYDLFEDFEENRDIAYTFVNSLNKQNNEKEIVNE